MDDSNIFIVVSKYERIVDNYGGRITDFDIHDTFATSELATAFLLTADKKGPSGYPREYSIVVRPLHK